MQGCIKERNLNENKAREIPLLLYCSI